jgi:hypothetical protein
MNQLPSDILWCIAESLDYKSIAALFASSKIIYQQTRRTQFECLKQYYNKISDVNKKFIEMTKNNHLPMIKIAIQIIYLSNSSGAQEDSAANPPALDASVILDCVDGAVRYGHLQILQWAYANYKNLVFHTYKHNLADLAVLHGHINIVWWVYSKKIFGRCHTSIVKKAVEKNRLELVAFILKYKKYSLHTDVLKNAIQHSSLRIVQLLFRTNTVVTNIDTITNWAVFFGKLDIVEWAFDNGGSYNIVHYIYPSDRIRKSGHTDVDNWLEKNTYSAHDRLHHNDTRQCCYMPRQCVIL